jgi:predicted transcriptional regulator of viral defense system
MKKTLISLDELPSKAFSLKEVAAQGISFYSISQLVKAGLLEKLGTGIYQKLNTDEVTSFDTSRFREATVRLGEQSCVCLWSALFFYDLTDELIEKTWIYVPYEKTSHNKDIKLIRKRDGKWRIGVVQMDGFKITSIERTLIEALSCKRYIALKDALKIARQAIVDKKVTLKGIVKIAKKLGMEDKIKETLVLLT